MASGMVVASFLSCGATVSTAGSVAKSSNGSLLASLASSTARATFSFKPSRRLKLTNPQLPWTKARILPPELRALLMSSSLSAL